MKYLIAITCSDEHDVDGSNIAQLSALLGDSAFLCLVVSDRTRSITPGDWVQHVDECVVWPTAVGAWVNPLIDHLLNNNVDVVNITADESEDVKPEPGFSL